MKIKQNKFIDLKHKNNTNYALVVLVCIIRGTYQITYNYLKKKVFIEVAQRLLKGFTITIKYENIIFILQMHSTYLIYTFFCQITTLIKVCLAIVFWLQTLLSIDFTKIFQLSIWSPKTKTMQTFMNVTIWRKKYI